MATTLGETTAAVTDQLGAEALAWATGAAEVVALATTEGASDATDGAPWSARVRAYVPALARTAARTATTHSSRNLRGLADLLGFKPDCINALRGGSDGECGP